jgi:hypothetical protein
MRIIGLLVLVVALSLGGASPARSEATKAEASKSTDSKASAGTKTETASGKAKPTQTEATSAKAAKSAAKGETSATPNAEAARKFETFCGSWLGKLRERERFNRTKIAWQKGPSGVVGEYVGYDTQKTRMLPPEDVKQSPVGKLVYMELRLRISGQSEADALTKGPEIVEQTEVTELFRYDRGAWVY